MADKRYALRFELVDGSEQELAFTVPQGPQGPQGAPGKDGNDYVLTEADKSEMVNRVLSALPTWTGGSY